MNRDPFLNALACHASFDATEELMRRRMHSFVAEQEDCFKRSLQIGHITASCWVIDPGRSRTLLCWHKRLDRWLQMGGHVEDDPSLLDSALRELREESGLSRYRPVTEAIFDLDIHAIPERPARPATGGEPARLGEPEHLHYDVRFLIEADPAEPVTLSPESRELAWVDLDRVAARNADTSMLRMVEKTRLLSG